MKKLALAALLAGFASAAVAGGLSEPETTPAVDMDTMSTEAAQQSSSNPNLVFPLAIVALFAAIAG